MIQNTSSRRLKCLELLNDFLQAATAELMWLSEHEEVEVTRDWLSKDLNLADLDEHHKVGLWHQLLWPVPGRSRLILIFPSTAVTEFDDSEIYNVETGTLRVVWVVGGGGWW